MRKYIDAFTVKRYTGIFIILAVVTVFSLMVNVTIAYLGDNDKKENVVKVGYADVSIVETFTEPSELSMTNDITKQVKIRNTGTVPAFVRVYAEFADSSIAEHAKVTYGTNNNTTTYSWDDFKKKLNYNSPSTNDKDSTLVESGWRYVPAENDTTGLGGYFYYTVALSPDAETISPLFYAVTIDYNKYKTENDTQIAVDSNIDRIQPVEMIIYTELVQSVDTGKSKVTTKTVDENGNFITTDGNGNTLTDENVGNPVESSVYGYDFDKGITDVNKDNWQDAWKRFLNKNTAREQSEVSKQAQ